MHLEKIIDYSYTTQKHGVLSTCAFLERCLEAQGVYTEYSTCLHILCVEKVQVHC